MTDPRILTLFMFVFLLLGVFSIFSGLRRLRAARAQGQRLAWYRQINLLTGIEYLLLSIVFITSLNFKTLPSGLKAIAVPFYLVLIALCVVVTGFVIRQAIANARGLRSNASSQAASNGASSEANEGAGNQLPAGQRASNIQRRRERRHKSASAHRRRAGRA